MNAMTPTNVKAHRTMTHLNTSRNASQPSAKPPAECADMNEIRHEIDEIDRVIIGLLGDRLGYVQAAAKFKTSVASVRALDRVATMLDDRETWAIESGLRPEPIRQLYVGLIDYFTTHELQQWEGG